MGALQSLLGLEAMRRLEFGEGAEAEGRKGDALAESLRGAGTEGLPAAELRSMETAEINRVALSVASKAPSLFSAEMAGAFRVDPPSGRIEAMGEMTFQVTFEAGTARRFGAEARLLVRGVPRAPTAKEIARQQVEDSELERRHRESRADGAPLALGDAPSRVLRETTSCARLLLSGEGVAAPVMVDRPALVMRTCLPGEQRSAEFVLRNTGAVPVRFFIGEPEVKVRPLQPPTETMAGAGPGGMLLIPGGCSVSAWGHQAKGGGRGRGKGKGKGTGGGYVPRGMEGEQGLSGAVVSAAE